MRWWRLRDRERDRDRLLRRGRLRLRDDERLELREPGPELRDEERLRERDDRRLERPEPALDGDAFSCGEPGHISFTYLDMAAEDMTSSLGIGLLPQTRRRWRRLGTTAKGKGQARRRERAVRMRGETRARPSPYPPHRAPRLTLKR